MDAQRATFRVFMRDSESFKIHHNFVFGLIRIEKFLWVELFSIGSFEIERGSMVFPCFQVIKTTVYGDFIGIAPENFVQLRGIFCESVPIEIEEHERNLFFRRNWDFQEVTLGRISELISPNLDQLWIFDDPLPQIFLVFPIKFTQKELSTVHKGAKFVG